MQAKLKIKLNLEIDLYDVDFLAHSVQIACYHRNV